MPRARKTAPPSEAIEENVMKTEEAQKKRTKKDNGIRQSNNTLPEGLSVIPQVEKKRFKPNIKGIDPRNVIFINGADKYKKETSPEEEVIHKFRVSQDPRIQTIFTGKVTGIRTLRSSKGFQVFALVNSNAGVKGYNGHIVMIPFQYMYIAQGTGTTRRIKEDDIKSQESYIHHMIGAEVEFTIKQLVESDENSNEIAYIIGSRKAAALKRINQYWYGKKEGDFILDIGSKVEARIVKVAVSGITVEVFGIEFFIPNKNLTYRILKDARTEFKIGKKVLVCIDEISRSENSLFAQVNARNAIEDPRIKYVQGYKVGDKESGSCVSVRYDDKQGRTIIYVNVDDKFDVYCSMSYNIQRVPSIGDTCEFMIRGVDYETGMVWGNIIHVSSLYV